MSDKLKRDKEFMLNAANQNGYSLRFASGELKNDREVVLTAVRQDGLAHLLRIQRDQGIVLKAIKQRTRERFRTCDESSQMQWFCFA